jgi:transcriptional regulator with XRE-family HTH domain
MARGKRKSRDELDELSRLFLDLRERAGLSQPDAALRAGITQSKLSRAETGRGVPAIATARRLAQIYKANADERRKLIDLVTVMKPARLDSRLIMQRGRNLRFQARIAEIERSCAVVRSYQPHMILGAVQTPAYALAVFTAHNSRPSRTANADRPEDLAAVRAERFRRLTAEQHRMWKLVMTEAALNWHVRSPELMVEQMGFLIDASRLPNVRLGIIPSRAPARVFAPHGFDMYDSRGVCIGTKTATALTTDAGDIADYEALFGELEQMAVHDDEARTLIARVATDYRAQADRERRADERAQSQGVPDAPAPTSDSQPAHS